MPKRLEMTARGDFVVTVDEAKFTPEFFEEFSKFMFPMDTVEEAMEHLGLMFARGVIDGSTDFIEGYGPAKEMGIKFEVGNGGSAWIDADVSLEEGSVGEPDPARW